MLHAEPTTVSLAFPSRKQYAIPSYQRNYVWTREGQWEPLWDDLRALTRQVLAEGQARPHFLGTIITKHIGTQGFIDRWWVVDGQQRLTTLQILIAAARSAFNEHGLTQCVAVLTDPLVNPPAVVREQPDKYKIEHKSSDYKGFSSIVEAGLAGSVVPDEEKLRLHECFDYFRAAVTDWFIGVPEDAREDHALVLTQAILDRLQVVDIRLDGQENSHAIFEALNARGEPLTEWEKTKNYLLSIAVRNDDPDGDRTYTEHLEQYDIDPYWDQTVSGTRFRGKRIDLFLSFFAQIELPKRRQEVSGDSGLHTLPRERLYREFRYIGEHVYRRHDEELRGLLRRLNRYATIFRQIDRMDSETFSEYARLVMHRRDRLTLSSLIPVFMVLVDRLGYGEGLDQALGIVDSYLMRRVALKATYSGFDDVAFGYVQVVRDAPAPEDICAVLIEQLEKAPWASRWPSDDEVVLHLRKADMYNGISGIRKQLLLRGVAAKMHEERQQHLAMPFQPKEALTIEHVAPQNWKRHWKDDLGFGDSDEDRQRLNQLVHRIGNLTLVTRELNSKISDRPWDHKANLLRADNLEMNRRLLDDMEGGTWNEGEIDRRSQIVADYVNEIWPHAATLRRQLGLAPKEEAENTVSGISPLVAERLVDSVTESGVEDGWADHEGLNRSRRDGRYGRYLRLGGGDHWHVVWFGVSASDRRLVLDGWDRSDAPDHLITVPDGIAFNEVLESVTSQVREAADSVAIGGSER